MIIGHREEGEHPNVAKNRTDQVAAARALRRQQMQAASSMAERRMAPGFGKALPH